jgi:outer membrane protein TolC
MRGGTRAADRRPRREPARVRPDPPSRVRRLARRSRGGGGADRAGRRLARSGFAHRIARRHQRGLDASGNLLPPRIGSARYVFSQSLPWFGKRDLRRDVAGAGADEAQARARAGWIDLATRIKLTYAQHHVHLTSIRYAQENLDLMRRVAEIARTRYASGFGGQQDALRAQTEIVAMETDLVDAGRRERPGQRAHARPAGAAGKRQAAPAGKAAAAAAGGGWTWSHWRSACAPTTPCLPRTMRASPARRRTAIWWSSTAIPM